MNSTVTLSVLSGSALGAEIALQQGVKTSIGSGEDCDFIFFDSTISLKHAAVEVQEEGTVVVYPLDDSVHYYDEQGAEYTVEDEQTPPLDAGTLFRIGGLYFACLNQDGEQSAQELLSRLASSAFRMHSGISSEFVDQIRQEIVQEPAQTEESEFAPTHSSDSATTSGKGKKIALTVVVLCLLAMLSVGVSTVMKPTEAVPEVQSALEQLQALTQRRPYARIEMAKTENGVIVISGKVGTFAELDALRKMVSAYPFPTLFRVRVLEQRIEAMQLTASQLGYNVKFTLDHGIVVGTGYVRSADELQELKKVIADNFSNMEALEWDIASAKDVAAVLKELLAKHEDLDALIAKYEKERVVLSGILGDSDREWVSGMPLALNKALQIPVPVELQVQFAKAKVKKRKLVSRKPGLITKNTIQQIGVGSMPFVRLKNGQVFFLGGKTSDGATITSISAKEIVLDKNGERKTIATE